MFLLLWADKEGVCFEDKEIFLFTEGGSVRVRGTLCAKLFDLLDLSAHFFNYDELPGYRSCIQ